MGLRERLGLPGPKQPDEPEATATVDGWGYCWTCRAYHADDAPWCPRLTDTDREPEWLRRRREASAGTRLVADKDYTGELLN